MSRFKIEITETTQERKIIGATWEQGANEERHDGYGYTPEIEATVDVEREIFMQNVSEMDIVDVIRAINGIYDVETSQKFQELAEAYGKLRQEYDKLRGIPR